MKKLPNKTTEAGCFYLPEIFEQFAPFFIPAYQRGYAWDDDNINDLINDILKTKEVVTYEHFTGTIVLIKKENKDGYDIIDGQQRLTSLFILLKSIYDKTGDENIYNQYIIKKTDNDKKSNLIQQGDVNNFFEEYIIKGNTHSEEKIFSHTRIKSAKSIFDEWLKNKSKEEIKLILEVMEKQLRFIVYNPQNAVNASAMFEIINNRGKELSELEKIKNYFVYVATMLGKDHSLHEKINKCWGDMLHHLNNADVQDITSENSFLRYCFITFFDAAKDKYQNIYETLKKDIFPITIFLENNNKTKNEKIDQMDRFLSFLVSAAKYYSYLLNPEKNLGLLVAENPKDTKTLKKVITYLFCHKSRASFIPLYLAIMSCNISTAEQVLLLDVLEKMNFRIYGIHGAVSRADAGQADLYRLANEFFNSRTMNPSELKNKIIDNTLYWTPLNKICEGLLLDDEDDYDFYDWENIKYFLARYEEFLEHEDRKTFNVSMIKLKRKDCDTGDYLSVEHIWARENRIQFAPPDYFGKRRLGNLVLLDLRTNIQKGKLDISEKLSDCDNEDIKADNYLNSLMQGRELYGIYKQAQKKVDTNRKRKGKYYYCDLYRHIAEDRELKLIKFALQTWALTDTEKKTAEEISSGNKYKSMDRITKLLENKNDNS